MSETPRHVSEALFYDRKVGDYKVEEFNTDHFLRVCCYPRLLEALGSLQGKRVCDFGCGDGKLAILLAQQGADVFGFDISPESIKLAEAYAEANKVSVRFDVMNAEHTSYPDGSFDFVVGNAILHHLDLPSAVAEVRRLLKPHGKALFYEPSASNPIIQFARLHVWYPNKARTPDEFPLDETQFGLFDRVEHREFTGSICRLLPAHKTRLLMAFEGPLRGTLDTLDKFLFQLFPAFKRWGRMVLVEIHG